jgi:hypothetical protein
MNQPDKHGYIERWLVGRVVFVIVVHANRCGWEIYTASRDNDIVASLADADARLGIGRLSVTESAT